MSIGVGDRVKRAKPLYEHSTRPDYREPERLGTVVKVIPNPQHEGDLLVRVEWDEVHDPRLVGGNAKRTMMRGSSLVVVEAAPRAATTEPMAVIRYKDGAVDDVAIHGDLFRLEQMDEAVWWLCVYRGKARAAFSLRLEGQSIMAEVIEDSIGCHDDSEGGEG